MKKPGLIDFYKKRILRILDIYIPVCLVFWILFDIAIKNKGFVKFLYDFSTLSFWFSGVKSVWYIAFIPLIYFIVPFLFKLMLKRRYWVLIYACMLVLYVIAKIMLIKYFNHSGLHER